MADKFYEGLEKKLSSQYLPIKRTKATKIRKGYICYWCKRKVPMATLTPMGLYMCPRCFREGL